MHNQSSLSLSLFMCECVEGGREGDGDGLHIYMFTDEWLQFRVIRWSAALTFVPLT